MCKDVFDSLAKSKAKMNNLRWHEQRALSVLNSGKDIIMRPPDKCGAVAVTHTSDYKEKVFRQLNIREYYQHLPDDPTQRFFNLLCRDCKALYDDKKFAWVTLTILNLSIRTREKGIVFVLRLT